jgi:F0F1-type ATP synthase delta subunit
MESKTVIIESQTQLTTDILESIVELISHKFNITGLKAQFVLNPELYGGTLITIGDKKIVLANNFEFGDMSDARLIVEHKAEIDDLKKTEIREFALQHFNCPKTVEFDFAINPDLIGGIRLRYRDEEIDLTIDKILEKAFSKI